jgi:hypothetical protein
MTGAAVAAADAAHERFELEFQVAGGSWRRVFVPRHAVRGGSACPAVNKHGTTVAYPTLRTYVTSRRVH